MRRALQALLVSGLRRAVALTACCLVLGACGERGAEAPAAAAKQTQIEWSGASLDAAFEQARAEDRPVLVYWSAEWCPYCKALEATVFTRPDFLAQAQRTIAVRLDGDQPPAQQWSTRLGVVGYPTLLLFRPDGTEIGRVSGGMDLERYAETVAAVLADERPVLDVLATAAAIPPQAAPVHISAADCRRLAYHGWELDADSEAPPPGRADELLRAATHCPPVETIARARLQVQALRVRLADESEAIAGGKAPSRELTAGMKELLVLLHAPETVRGTADILASFDDAVYGAAKAAGSDFAGDFGAAWISAMQSAAEDIRFGESERLLYLATALDGGKQMAPDGAIPPEMATLARERVAAALTAGPDAGNRHDVVNAARIVYVVLEDDEALQNLLTAEIATSATPYYYMPALAGLAEKRGRTDEAIGWLRKACEATTAPGARVRWCTRYVGGLTRLAPDDVATIERASLQVADAYNQRDVLVAERPAGRGAGLRDALGKWATTAQRKTVLTRVEERLGPAGGDPT